MIYIVCAADCGRPAHNARLCGSCQAELRSLLLAVAEPLLDQRGQPLPLLEQELDKTIARMDQLGSPYTSGGRSAEKPLIFKEHASEARVTLTDTLGAWAGEIAGHRGVSIVEDPTPAGFARFLLRWHGYLSDYQFAEQALDEIRYAVRQAVRAIDRPVDRRIFLGRCGHILGEGGCKGHVYCRPYADEGECDLCGELHNVARRQAVMLDAVRGKKMTALEMSTFLARMGIELSSEEIRKAARPPQPGLTPKLKAVDHDGHGRGIYRVGDVLRVFPQTDPVEAFLPVQAAA